MATDTALSEIDVYRMIEKVRCETRLSHKLACHAVHVVLENLSFLRPSLSVIFNDTLRILEMIPEAPKSLIDETQDMACLLTIAEALDSVRNDAQQRSWELFDDQATIVEHLNELLCILMDADVAISKRFLYITEYHIVNCLAEYYQMETRWIIKLILLKIFSQLCTLSKTAIVILLASMLPLELTRDVQNNCEDKTKLVAAIDVLTKLFSIGEPLPVIYFDTIGREFVWLLLDLIESPRGDSDSDQDEIVAQLVNFILMYNLQFDKDKSLAENLTVQALSDTHNPKIFSETLSLLFNRANLMECADHATETPNALLKMMIDIFSHDSTCNLFYDNDVRVLIDIVLRQLVDNSPKNNDRYDLLNLLKQILFKRDSSIYVDRILEINNCITRLPVEEEEVEITSNKQIDEIKDHLNKLKI